MPERIGEELPKEIKPESQTSKRLEIEGYSSFDDEHHFRIDSQAEGPLWPHELRVEDLIQLRHPLPQEKIESEGAARENPASFMETQYPILSNPVNIEDLKEIFHDQIVVDLGAGETNYGYRLVALAGARGYIGVEPHFSYELRNGQDGMGRIIFEKALPLERGRYTNIPKIPWSIVNLDMLSFLQAAPDNSLSFFAAGIDDAVLHDHPYEIKTYKEIERALSPDGAFLSIHSWLYYGDDEKRTSVSGRKITQMSDFSNENIVCRK